MNSPIPHSANKQWLCHKYVQVCTMYIHVCTWYIHVYIMYICVWAYNTYQLAYLESHSSICLTPKQPLTCFIQIHFKFKVLVALEHWIFHDFLSNIFLLTSPQVEILVPISLAFPHVEALDTAILDCLVNSLVQIRMDVLGIKCRVLQHSNNPFELLLSPSGQNMITDISNMYMYVQCT